jgi:hypothetical protein
VRLVVGAALGEDRVPGGLDDDAQALVALQLLDGPLDHVAALVTEDLLGVALGLGHPAAVLLEVGFAELAGLAHAVPHVVVPGLGLLDQPLVVALRVELARLLDDRGQQRLPPRRTR